MSSSKTVVVLGASYGGAHAAKLLADTLPPDWRVLAIDRMSHMNHVYVFPRYAVVPKHAPKAFIPYDNLFKPAPVVDDSSAPPTSAIPTPPPTPAAEHAIIQGEVVCLEPNAVTVRLPENGDYDGATTTQRIEFKYCVYALGAALPAPCDVWGEPTALAGRGSKKSAVEWMKTQEGVIKQAQRIVIVGAGALGIQFATDIKDLYPAKEVTLLHSRTRMLPRYDQAMHDAVVAGLEKLGVNVVLGERVVSWPENVGALGESTIHTDKGSVFTADLVLACTGQKPHTALIAGLDDKVVNPATGRISVRPTLQVSRCRSAEGEVAGGMARMNLETPVESQQDPLDATGDSDADLDHLDHIFAIGDCADTEAIQAGHTAYYMAEVAARNILKLVTGASSASPSTEDVAGDANGNAGVDKDHQALEAYKPTPPMIKVTLGIKHYAIAGPDGVTTGDDGAEDLEARYMWKVYSADGLEDDA